MMTGAYAGSKIGRSLESKKLSWTVSSVGEPSSPQPKLIATTVARGTFGGSTQTPRAFE